MKHEKTKIRYALADDHRIFRQGLKMILSQYKHIEFVCEAGNGIELMKELEKNIVDIVMLDLSMPELNGFETIQEMGRLYPDTRVLVLSMHDDEQMVAHAMQLGANGYILKNADPEEISSAIHSVMETGYYFNNVVSAAILRKLIMEKRVLPVYKKTNELTERELSVLKMVCNEMTSSEIGEKLFLSTRTVEGIRTSLMEKVGVRNIAGLVAYAFKNNLV